jgi:nicotinamidase-related amidase
MRFVGIISSHTCDRLTFELPYRETRIFREFLEKHDNKTLLSDCLSNTYERRSKCIGRHAARRERISSPERKIMNEVNGRSRLSEKGLLTPDNCVVALIDLQPQMLFGTANFDRQGIINSNVVLSKASRVFDVPVVLSTVETKGFSGNMWPQIQAIFPERIPIERTTMNAWDDKNFVAAIEKTGKKKIVLAGLWTETCVALPTIQAIHDGYEIYVVEDCCGDVSVLAHDNAMRRVIQAGAKPVTSLMVMLEWQRDWAAVATYDAVMDIVKNHYGAYGIGVEYAYTMVHGAPATKFPEYSVPVPTTPHK